MHGATFCNVHSEVGYELVLGMSWLGYELAWYDLVRVRVDWKPTGRYPELSPNTAVVPAQLRLVASCPTCLYLSYGSARQWDVNI